MRDDPLGKHHAPYKGVQGISKKIPKYHLLTGWQSIRTYLQGYLSLPFNFHENGCRVTSFWMVSLAILVHLNRLHLKGWVTCPPLGTCPLSCSFKNRNQAQNMLTPRPGIGTSISHF